MEVGIFANPSSPIPPEWAGLKFSENNSLSANFRAKKYKSSFLYGSVYSIYLKWNLYKSIADISWSIFNDSNFKSIAIFRSSCPTQRSSYKHLFWKYIANLEENIHNFETWCFLAFTFYKKTYGGLHFLSFKKHPLWNMQQICRRTSIQKCDVNKIV